MQKEELMEPVEARERALVRLGAVWRPPLLLDVRRFPSCHLQPRDSAACTRAAARRPQAASSLSLPEAAALKLVNSTDDTDRGALLTMFDLVAGACPSGKLLSSQTPHVLRCRSCTRCPSSPMCRSRCSTACCRLASSLCTLRVGTERHCGSVTLLFAQSFPVTTPQRVETLQNNLAYPSSASSLSANLYR